MNEDAFSMLQHDLEQMVRSDDTGCTARDDKLEQQLQQQRVTPLTVLSPLESLFRMYGLPCFYRGELVAVCGKAKSGKTFFLSLLMACALKQKVLALERAAEQPYKVLWLDTEQSAQSTQDIMLHRIMPLAEQKQLDGKSFYAYNLRGLGYEVRRRMMELAINRQQPDLVVLDGVKDLLTDINDAVQATFLTEQLMALAQKYHCCLLCVLHQNKGEQDRNMRGSIGTELSNKAFEVFQCELLEDTRLFKVSQTLTRKLHIDQKLYFRIDEQGSPRECDAPKEQPRDEKGRYASYGAEAKWESFNERYIIHHEEQPDKPYSWNLRRLFEDAMENRSSRPYAHVMAAALKLSRIQDKRLYYRLFSEAVSQGLLRTITAPKSGDTYVELIQNELPF